jgi:cyclic 2,3-diphosphoglycerate synthetase
VLFDGSGAALPPVAVGRRIVIAGAQQDSAVTTGYLNTYRHLLADLIVVTMAEEGSRHEELVTALRRLVRPGVAVIPAVLRPQPTASVTGRETAFFGTAPPHAHARIASHLRVAHGAEVVHISGNLADRAALRAELPHVDADVFLVELKAAAVDVVAEEALRRDVEVVLAANDVVPLAGGADLDYEIRRLAEEAEGAAAVLAGPAGQGE